MAFADPQSVVLPVGTLALPRVGFGPSSGSFKLNDAADGVTAELLISHSYGKRVRRTARLNITAVSPDPFNSALNALYSSSYYLVVDHPVVGFDQDQMGQYVTGLTTWLDASSGLAIDKLMGGEV